MDVREYIYDMPRVMAAADIVLCRAGASTISELTYMHKPTIFVPSPFVTNNHQFKNAKVVEDAGGALIFEEGWFEPKELLNAVKRILSSPDELNKMSAAMEKLAMPEATNMICDRIFPFAKVNNKSEPCGIEWHDLSSFCEVFYGNMAYKRRKAS